MVSTVYKHPGDQDIEVNASGKNAPLVTIAAASDGVSLGDPKVTDTSTIEVETLSGGSHVSVDVDVSSTYKINPDIDTFYKLSSGTNMYGTTSTYGGLGTSPGWETGNILLTDSNVDLGSAGFSIDFYAIFPTTMSTTAHNFFVLGDDSGGAVIALKQDNVAGVFRLGQEQIDDAGVDCGAGSGVVSTGIDLHDTLIRHVVLVVDRTTGASAASTTCFIDGTQVYSDVYTDTGVACDIAAATGRGTVATNKSGTNHGADITLFDLKIYTAELTLPQIQARNDAAGVIPMQVVDAADASLDFWINCQNGSTLAHESGYGSLVYTAQVSATIELGAGATAASPIDSDVVWSKDPVYISTGDDTKLGLYSQSGNSGDVRLVKI